MILKCPFCDKFSTVGLDAMCIISLMRHVTKSHPEETGAKPDAPPERPLFRFQQNDFKNITYYLDKHIAALMALRDAAQDEDLIRVKKVFDNLPEKLRESTRYSCMPIELLQEWGIDYQ